MRNTPAFTGMAIVGLVIGFAMFFIGLFNASFELNVKGYYIAVMLLIAYSAIGVQKVTRDNAEDKLFMEQTQGHNQNTQA
ncbi:YiaA/YiaB family inner membrane protein [Paenibacillus hexagrammi]